MRNLVDNVPQGTYTVYIQIRRPDGARCGFTTTCELTSESCKMFTTMKRRLRHTIGKATQAARGNVHDIITAPLKKVSRD